jgi:hypothetical protein
MEGLTRLDSPTLAKKLATRTDAPLMLIRLQDLTPEAATGFQGTTCTICLMSLTTIDDAVAQSLGARNGGVDLDGVQAISDAAAESLAKSTGPLDLGGVRELTPEAAVALGKHRGALCLGGLSHVSVGIAQGLKSHEGHLQLSGMRELPPEVAKALVGCSGLIYLDGVHTLSDEAALILATHRGGSDTGFILMPQAIRSLSAAADASLRRNRLVHFGNRLGGPSVN